MLRTVQFDASDAFVFVRAAAPGEWAVSGAFAFMGQDIAALQGKARTGFRAGFLGISSLGRSTLVRIVDIREQDRAAAAEMLAAQLLTRFGAPDHATARAAAEEEIAFAASLCGHPAGVIVAVTRTLENGSIREVFRTLRPNARSPSRAFNFVEVAGEEEGGHVDLEALGKGARI
jgi:hypothetical protein